MFHHTLLASALGMLALPLAAQCSALTVTGGAPGTALQVALDATDAHAIVFLLVSQDQGSVVLDFGQFGSVTLGLGTPILPIPIGITDSNGDAARDFPVPSATTLGLDLYGQGLTAAFSFSIPTGGGMPTFGLTLCESNVVAFHVGV